MRVERITGEVGEFLDVVQRDRPRFTGKGLADLELAEFEPEGMRSLAPLGRTRHPAVRHTRQHPRRTLQRRALHIVEYATQAAHLLAAARASRTAVYKHWQRRAVAGRFASAVAVDDEQTTVKGAGAGDHGPRYCRIVGEDRHDERTLAAVRK